MAGAVTAAAEQGKQPEREPVSREIDMTDKELKRLSRAELLELLLIQTKETERLTKKLEKAEKMLVDRQLRMEKAGDIAQAALAVNGVMEAAQAAAQQYLDNIARMEKETAARCEKMLIAARREAARILKEAREAAAVSRPRTGTVRAPRETGENADIVGTRAGTVQVLPKRKNQ